MTFAEFKRQVTLICKTRCNSTEFSPLQFGIDRAFFEEEKLGKLIVLADKVKSTTAQRRKEAWQRQLIRVRANRLRLEQMKSDLARARLQIEIPKMVPTPAMSRSSRRTIATPAALR